MNLSPERVFTEPYKVSSYLVNLRGRAGLYSTLNLVQDVGWLHAFRLNVEIEPHHGWVLTRQKLVMQEWPAWNETVTLRTWLRPPEGIFLARDYELFLGERKIGEATSSFTVMDLNTRKVAQVDWSKSAGIWRPDGHLTLKPEKILPEGEGRELARFQVRNSDLDMNNHVNNTRYAQWILDSLPVEMLRKGVNLHAYEVNFLAEAKSGDEIAIQQLSAAPTEGRLTGTTFQGVKQPDGRPVFTARLWNSPDQ